MGPGIWLLGGRQDRLSLFGRVGSLISRRYNGPFVLTFPCQAWEVLAKGLFLFCRNYTKKGRKEAEFELFCLGRGNHEKVRTVYSDGFLYHSSVTWNTVEGGMR